jgi:hypothetical protein
MEHKRKYTELHEMTRPESKMCTTEESECRAGSPECQGGPGHEHHHHHHHAESAKFFAEPDMSFDSVIKIRALKQDIYEQEDPLEGLTLEKGDCSKTVHFFEEINLMDPFPARCDSPKKSKKPRRLATSKKILTQRELFNETPTHNHEPSN